MGLPGRAWRRSSIEHEICWVAVGHASGHVDHCNGADKNQWCKAQGAPNGEGAFIGIQSSQNFCRLFGLGNRGKVFLALNWRQCTAEIARRITFGSPCGNRIAEYLPRLSRDGIGLY